MTELAREYGNGLYSLAMEEQQETEWLEQLKLLKQCFREQYDFIRLLGNMSLPKDERIAVLDAALKGQIHAYLLNFLKLLCERGILTEFESCEAVYRDNYNHAHQILEATVTTGAPLTKRQRDQLVEKLKSMTGKSISLQEKVDPSVLGGVVLEMDGKRYDNSVAHRLADMKRFIAGEA